MSETQNDRGVAQQDSSNLSEADAQDQIDALRAELAHLSEKARGYAEHTARSVADATSQGTAELKSTIRRHPATSIVVAAGAGAVLAMLIVPRPTPRSRYQQFQNYLPDMSGYGLAMERAWNRAVPTEHLNGISDSISASVGSVDVQNNLSAVAERAMNWWDEAKKRVAAKQKSG